MKINLLVFSLFLGMSVWYIKAVDKARADIFDMVDQQNERYDEQNYRLSRMEEQISEIPGIKDDIKDIQEKLSRLLAAGHG